MVAFCLAHHLLHGAGDRRLDLLRRGVRVGDDQAGPPIGMVSPAFSPMPFPSFLWSASPRGTERGADGGGGQ